MPYNGVTLVGLYFETDRVPYVVKNHKGGQIQREVPWRELNGTQSATRAQLLRMLVPVIRNPIVEFVSGELRAHESKDGTWLRIRLGFYIVARSRDPVVIPFHLCKLEGDVVTGETVSFSTVQLHPIRKQMFKNGDPHMQSLSFTAQSSDTEIQINGAGMVYLRASVNIGKAQRPLRGHAALRVALRDAGAETDVSLTAMLEVADKDPQPPEKAIWKAGRPIPQNVWEDQ